MKLTTIATSALLAAGPATASVQHKHIESRELTNTQPQAPIAGAMTYQGCWSSGGNMTVVMTSYAFAGTCSKACAAKNFPAFGKNERNCYCGMLYPPESKKVDNSHCQTPCDTNTGFGDPCPTGKYFAIYNDGINVDVDFMKDDKSSSSGSSTATSSTDGTPAKTEVVVTQTRDSEPTDDSDKSKKSGPNVAGIAAGVVVGVVVAAAAIGGLFFWLRRKRNAEIEEDHRRNAAVNAFISGSKPPSAAGGSISMSDTRLDPGLSHRRLSDGSIADNEDYSRRILRVTNA